MKKTSCCKNDEISLRDYLAGQIACGACLSPGWQGRDQHLASYSYAVADAMIKARDKEN